MGPAAAGRKMEIRCIGPKIREPTPKIEISPGERAGSRTMGIRCIGPNRRPIRQMGMGRAAAGRVMEIIPTAIKQCRETKIHRMAKTRRLRRRTARMRRLPRQMGKTRLPVPRMAKMPRLHLRTVQPRRLITNRRRQAVLSISRWARLCHGQGGQGMTYWRGEYNDGAALNVT
jgi:hypothetical protein